MKKVEFDYYYGVEAEQFTFLRVPKILFTSPLFKTLSNDAKLLYGLMLERVGLSQKNGWLDEDGRVYIYFTLEAIQEDLGCGKDKGIRLLKELDSVTGIGLIERKRQGLGKPDKIYVKNFVTGVKNEISSEVEKSDLQKSEKPNSGSRDTRHLEFEESDPNKKNKNNTETSNTNLINPKHERNYSEIEKEVKDRIEYDILCSDTGVDKDILDELVNVMAEVLCSTSARICVAKEEWPSDFVKDRFRKIGYEHIRYVLGCLNENTCEIRNAKSFLRTVLFNAPATMNNYIQSVVNYMEYGDGYRTRMNL